MQKKPFGADLDFYDGQWVIPYALLALSTLYWDIGWTKLVLIVMFVIACFHIMYEHRIVFGKKEINKRRLFNLGGFVGGILVGLIMPVYSAVTYAIFASQLKKDGENQLLMVKRKTYTRMFLILSFAVVIHALQGFMAADKIRAGMQADRAQGQQTQEAVPGTIR
jgi:4-hydroxybenzoate polyprenyltransferase